MDLRDFSEYSNEGYNDYMLDREHPMCRCSIIIKPEDEFFTYCTGWFIWRYKEECKESPIWRN